MAVLVSPRKRRRLRGDIDTSAVETIKSAYAALGRNDPSVLFAAMDPTINWNEAEGNPLADRNPYVGPQAVGDGVFGRLLAAIDNFTAVPSTFIDGGINEIRVAIPAGSIMRCQTVGRGLAGCRPAGAPG